MKIVIVTEAQFIELWNRLSPQQRLTDNRFPLTHLRLPWQATLIVPDTEVVELVRAPSDTKFEDIPFYDAIKDMISRAIPHLPENGDSSSIQ